MAGSLKKTRRIKGVVLLIIPGKILNCCKWPLRSISFRNSLVKVTSYATASSVQLNQGCGNLTCSDLTMAKVNVSANY